VSAAPSAASAPAIAPRGAARALAALLVGVVFGAGLAIAQMTDPRKVLNFLDLTGRWDASLLFVLGGAVAVAFVGYRVVLRRAKPLFDDAFHLPTSTAIDAALVCGAVLFGLGWGLAGYCPGPAIASLGLDNPETLWFLPALALGAFAQRWRARRASRAGS
jgi:uncharacterized membrane protein YedE/YeeE